MRIPVIVVKVTLLLLAGLFLYSLYARQVDVDDAWLGEHAWYQSKLGYVKSELMRGVTTQEVRTVIHHKLLTLHGSLAVKIAGFSLYTLKSVSLFYFLLFIALFYWYMVPYRKLVLKEEFLLLLLILLAHPLVFAMAFVYRPEVPMMFYGFLSFILLKETVISERRSVLPAFAGGLASGLCVAFHLNGVIFIAAGALLLLFYRNYRGAAVFLAGCILTTSIYFYDFTKDFGFSYWLAQITQSPFHTRTANYFSWKTMIISLFREHLRFFHRAEVTSFSALLIFALIMGWRSLKKIPVISLYTLLLVFFLALIALYKTTQYMVVYLPFLMVIVVMIFKERMLLRIEPDRKGYFVNGFALFFLVLFLGIAFYADVKLTLTKFDSSVNRNVTEQYFAGSSGEKRMLAPMEFIFNEIGNYKGIQGLLQYNEHLHTDSSYFGAGLLTHAEANGEDCIYLDGRNVKIFGLEGVQMDSVIAGYRVIGRTPDLLVFDRVK
jgi:hypothetical protein